LAILSGIDVRQILTELANMNLESNSNKDQYSPRADHRYDLRANQHASGVNQTAH
jgi:hypothetical protein